MKWGIAQAPRTKAEDMAKNGNGLPPPDAHWVALGIVVAALAEGLGAKRRARFFAALRSLIDDHEASSRVVVFGSATTHRRDLPHSIRVATRWLRRLTTELDSGPGQ